MVEVLLAATLSALLAGALVHLFAGALDLSRTVRQQATESQDAQLAVTLLHQDIRQADRILEAGAGKLTLLGQARDTIRYGWATSTSDTLARRINGGAAEILAAGVDTLHFSLQTVARPYTTEMLMPDTVEAVVTSFSPGDWDEWVAESECEYRSRGQRRIEDQKWCAEEFWPTENFDAFSRIALRVWAEDHQPPQVDLLVEIYAAEAGGPEYPGELLAEGRISRFSLTDEPAWHETPLAPRTNRPVAAGEHYWLVLRPDGAGLQSYAGHVELERVQECDGAWPGEDYRYRKTDDAGYTWSDPTDAKDFFLRIEGQQATQKLTEVTSKIVDTLGVVYRLQIGATEEPQRREGFVALENL